MKTMYRVGKQEKNPRLIREISVVKETAAFIFVDYGNGRVRRQKKETSWFTTFDTRAEATDHVAANANRADQKIRGVILRDAAPELLEALEGAVSKWERDAVIYKAMNAEYNPEPGWLIKARAAIAKAKGES